MDDQEHLRLNLANWNDRVPVHVGANSSYDIDRYVSDPGRISKVVEFDRDRLGDLTGLDVVHLQCHIGTDTLSLARLGASVAGVDFSPPAIAAARELFERCGTAGRFVESEVYDSAGALGGATYDVVYTGVGAINWLPDITAWAEVVASLLKPGGRLVLRDGHPSLFILDDRRSDDQLVPFFSYFSTDPLHWDDNTTYADDAATIANTRTMEWVHTLSSVVNAVIGSGLRLDRLDEFDTIDWKALDHMVEAPFEQWSLPDHQRGFTPLGFAIEATRLP